MIEDEDAMRFEQNMHSMNGLKRNSTKMERLDDSDTDIRRMSDKSDQ
jgi:hypothetical protein